MLKTIDLIARIALDVAECVKFRHNCNSSRVFEDGHTEKFAEIFLWFADGEMIQYFIDVPFYESKIKSILETANNKCKP